MKPKKNVMVCTTAGSIHRGYLCHHKLERYSEYNCEKCKNTDETDEEWNPDKRRQKDGNV